MLSLPDFSPRWRFPALCAILVDRGRQFVGQFLNDSDLRRKPFKAVQDGGHEDNLVYA
jgi:hypothetical protein